MIVKLYRAIKNLLGYQPPVIPDPFVLDEKRPYDSHDHKGNSKSDMEQALEAVTIILRYAHRLENFMIKLGNALREERLTEETKTYQLELDALKKQFSKLTPILIRYEQSSNSLKTQSLSTSIEENQNKLENIYRLPQNKDIVFRTIHIASSPLVKAIVVFIDGMVDSRTLNLSVLQPLMLFDNSRNLYGEDFIERIINECLPNSQVKRGKTFGTVEEAINSGDTAIIFDGIDEAVFVNTKGWEHRGVSRPQLEQTTRGSQAGFSENIRVNTGLIRSMLRSSDLVTEMIPLGTRSRINCAMMYIESIANPALVAEIRRRLEGIKTDYLGESGQLIQFIEDHPTIPYPQSLSTERPDRVVAHLSEGRIALILEGNPFVHVLPVSFFTFFHSAEDFSLNTSIANFMRILRLLGSFLATLLPSFYLALNYFHQEALPTELLLTISAAHENVPFPAWFEVIVMELSFELIREAGTRIPGFLGSTIGVVGAIIIGQAAVAAHIVSPIVVVIIAITGLSSFTVPEYRMSSAIRITRLLLNISAIFMGLVGIGTGILWITILLCRMKSFGVPYMAPVAPKTNAGLDVILRGQVFNQESRPDELNLKDKIRQPNISRLWKEKKTGR